MYTPYIFPSENGHRGGTRWVAIHSAAGCGVWVGGDKPLGFSVMPHTTADMTAAMHQSDLTPKGTLQLNVTAELNPMADGHARRPRHLCTRTGLATANLSPTPAYVRALSRPPQLMRAPSGGRRLTTEWPESVGTLAGR